MNRRQLEKMFDEEFDLWTTLVQNNFWEHRVNNNNEVKDFIFDTIIPEVLKSVITKELVFDEKEENDDWFYWLFNLIVATHFSHVVRVRGRQRNTSAKHQRLGPMISCPGPSPHKAFVIHSNSTMMGPTQSSPPE